MQETAYNAEDPGLIPRLEDSLEKEMAIHSSILAWEIPWTEEPGGLQSMGLQSQIRLSVQEHTHTHVHTQVSIHLKHLISKL